MNNYNGLVMPNNYAVVNEDEMTYVDGGGIKVNRSMLDKAYCLAIATKYCTGLMNYFSVAKEIHAHAVMYYAILAPYTIANIANVSIGFVNEIYTRSKEVDLGNDSLGRRIVYEAIWKYV